jgi:hypothetical protein
MRRYQQFMRSGEPARIRDLSADELDQFAYMGAEELAGVADPGDGRGLVLVPLSDARAPVTRKYPGSPLPDKAAGAGPRLGPRLAVLVRGALVQVLLAGRSVGRRAGLRRFLGGYEVTARQVCAAVNAIIARDPGLRERYRYASLWAVQRVMREVLPDLAERGEVEELRAPRPVRQRRSWRTLPRVLRLVPPAAAAAPP